MKTSKKVTKVAKVTKVTKSSEPVQPAESAIVAQTASTPPVTDVTTEAANAIASLRHIASVLPLDDSLTPSELKHARAGSRVPLEVLSIAAGVLEEDPSRFPDFDASQARNAVTYEQTLVPVAVEARALAASIDRSVMKYRSGAADQSLALYATLKGLSRVPTNEKTRSQVKDLRALLSKTRKIRATSVTQVETKQLVKVAKSAKVASVKSTKASEAAAEAAAATALANLAAGSDSATAPTPAAPVVSPPEPVTTATPVVVASH
jgi:hypothetical protein